MGINRAMALSALILAIMLAIGAVQPDRPTAGAAHSQIIIIATPALPTLAPQLPAQQVEAPTADPALVPGTPEYNAALAEIYASLPTIECPCGPAPAEYTGAMTDRQIRQSRARTR